MCVCILLKGSETFFRASRYFVVVFLMADSDAEVNIHVSGEDEVQDDSKLISDAPVADGVPLAGEAKECQIKRRMQLSKSHPLSRVLT
jgi:hypothetical protein